MAERFGINVCAREITRQRHFSGQRNRIVERLQDSANLNVFQSRLKGYLRIRRRRIQCSRQRNESTVEFALQLGNFQQTRFVGHLRGDIGKIHPTPAHVIGLQQNICAKPF